jgi:DNA polymerase-3 subunit alpha
MQSEKDNKTQYITQLRVTSSYSLLTSVITIDEYINFGKKNNLTFLSLADEYVLYGVYEFYQACINAKIKPIIGVKLTYLLSGESLDITIYAKNYRGYQNLLFLSSMIMSQSEKKIKLSES